MLPRLDTRQRAKDGGDARIYWWLLALILATVFEGALRKWFLPASLQALAYGAKDVIAVLFVLEHPIAGPACTARRIRAAVVAVAILLIPAFVLGLSDNPLAAVSTYKNAVLWPLLALHLALRIRVELLDRLLFPLTVIACFMAALGAAQYSSPGSSILNQYAWRGFDAYTPVASFGVGGGTRASGTFSYISGMAIFAEFCFSYSLWQSVRRSTHQQRMLAAIAAVASVLCALESGSRAPIVVFVVLLTAATLIARNVKVFLRIWAVLALTGIALAYTSGGEILNAFANRWETAGDTLTGRITGEGLKADFWQLIASHPLGVGLGQTTGFGTYNTILTTGIAANVYDDGGSTAVLESGIAGLVSLWLISGSLAGIAWRAIWRSSYELRCATALLGAVPIYWVWNGIWYNHTASAFTWLTIGFWLSRVYTAASETRAKRPSRYRNLRRESAPAVAVEPASVES